jgi:hypothetical protein
MSQRRVLSRRSFLASVAAAGAIPASLAASESAGRAGGPEVPWLAEVQRPPKVLPADAPRLAPLLVDQAGRPITTREGWQRKRQAIRRWWLEFLKPLPAERKRPPPIQVIEEDRPQGARRQLIRYEVEPGLPVEAYLLYPARDSAAPRPGVVVLHSTVTSSIRQPAGLEGEPEMALGLLLARRGYVAFCPRNFLWPANRKMATQEEVARFRARHPGSKGMAKMLFDAMLAVDLLAGLPGVDPARLAALGHSLGGKEVLYLAALDERIRASVSSEGGIGIGFSNWHDPWYLGDEVRRGTFGHEHHELLALVAPRPFLLLGGDSADGARSWPFIEAVLPVYRLYGGPARLGLLNHRRGHSIPADAQTRIDQWLEAYC